jgi:hypothetical protein
LGTIDSVVVFTFSSGVTLLVFVSIIVSFSFLLRCANSRKKFFVSSKRTSGHKRHGCGNEEKKSVLTWVARGVCVCVCRRRKKKMGDVCRNASSSIWVDVLGYIALAERLECRMVSQAWMTHVKSSFRWEHTLDIGNLHFRNVPVCLILAVIRVARTIHTVLWLQSSSPLHEDATRWICEALLYKHSNNIQHATVAPVYHIQYELFQRTKRLVSFQIESISAVLPQCFYLAGLIRNGIDTSSGIQ